MIARLAVAAGLLIASAAVQAQQAWSEEYAKRIRSTEEVTPLGDAMFGDSIKLFDGSLSFSAVDVSVPGNSNIPVEFRRTLVIGDQAWPNPMADWQIDVPYIGGVYEASHADQLACDKGTPPFVAHPSNPNVVFHAKDYWSGTQLHIDGGSQEMLVPLDAGSAIEARIVKPTFANYAKWRTKSNWAFRCLAAPLANGASAQGFVGYAPDGLRYTFNWRILRDAPPIARQLDPYHAYQLNRVEVRLYATKVEDRFGNVVNYNWSGNNLDSITSNDGRSITLAYSGTYNGPGGSYGRLLSVSSHGRTWTYAYGNYLNNSPALTSVTNPDASVWTYVANQLRPTLEYEPLAGTNAFQSSPLKNQAGANLVCSKTPQFKTTGSETQRAGGGDYYVTHPSGATARFYLSPLRHGRANVPFMCVNTESDDLAHYNNIPLAHDVLSVLTKQIDGPGLASLVYNYGYTDLAADYRAYSHPNYPVYNPPQAPTHYKTVVVTQPDGTSTTHKFGKDYELNEGRLLQSLVKKAGVTLQTTDTTFMSDTEALNHPAMPERMGKTLAWGIDDYSAATLRPVIVDNVNRDATDFTMAVPAICGSGSTTRCVNAFAQNEREHKGSLLGYREESYGYSHNLNHWVIGQRNSVRYGSTPVEYIAFDPTTALPMARYEHGNANYPSLGTASETFSYHTGAGQAGMPLSVADGIGNTIWLSSWKRGIPQTIQYPAAPSIAYDTAIVNDRGLIDSTTDEMGYLTSYGYDSMGRLSSVVYPTGDSTAWSSKSLSFLRNASAEVGLPAGHWKHTTTHGNYNRTVWYDAFWRPVLTREYDAANAAATTRFSARAYDHAGRETFASYPVASATTYQSPTDGTRTTYDGLGRVTKVAQNSELGVLNTTTQYLSGFQRLVTNPRNHGTTIGFQAFDDPDEATPTVIAQPEGVTTYILRDNFGKPTSIQRSGTYGGVAVSSTRSYVYDAMQRLCKRVDPESGATQFAYDAAGRVSWKAEGQAFTSTWSCDTASVAAGNKTSYAYDALGRLLTSTPPAPAFSTSRTYYADGALASASTSAQPSNPIVWTYQYNKRRLLTQEVSSMESMTFVHAYDSLGHLASTTYPAGYVASYAPNALGQPTQVSGFVSGAQYHPNGSIKQYTYANGITRVNTLNQRGTLQRMRDTYGSTVFHDFQYAFDQNGNVGSITDHGQSGLQNRTMSYDGLDRLLTTSAPSVWGSASYVYDPLDNIRESNVGTRQHRYVYSANWHLVQANTPSGTPIYTATYDARGNMTSQWGGAFTFDRANRLTGVAAVASSYYYDAHDRRIAQIRPNGGLYTLYTADGLLRGGPQSTPTQFARRWHVYLGKQPVGMRTESLANGTITNTFLHPDALGSPVVETDASRNVVCRTIYEPYGIPTNRSVGDESAFTGHFQDADTGFVYMQARYYHPQMGRFLSVDPVGVDPQVGSNFNRYWYTRNNPYRFVDPDGRLETELYGEMLVSSQAGYNDAYVNAQVTALGYLLFGTDVNYIAPPGSGEVSPASTPFESALAGTKAVRIGAAALRANRARAAVAAASKPYNSTGLSVAARKLEQHAGRKGGTFTAPTGSVADKNAAAANVVQDIVGSSKSVRTELSGGGFEYRLPNGQGVRFDADGSFNTFLDPYIPKR